jgi:hypothetical protein
MFSRLRELERQLPQHDLQLPFPEGGQGRFVRFSNQLRQVGWGNVLAEM